MKTYSYDMSNVPAEERTFFQEMIPYVSEFVLGASCSGGSLLIEYETIGEEILVEKVQRLETMIINQLKGAASKPLQTKVLTDCSNVTPPNRKDVFQDLVDCGAITQVNRGSFVYSGIFCKVMRYFENRVEAFAKEVFGKYENYRMPDLIPIVAYEKGGYFDTFPHHIMFQTTLANDLKVIDKFSRDKTSDPAIFDCLKTPQNVLRTAACMPLYPVLEHARIPQDKPGKFVVEGHCFRNEEGNVKTLERVNEFTMKELVCVGTPDQTSEFLVRCKELWLTWQDVFGLNMRIETANDSFFANNYKKLRLFQLLGDAKCEYKLLVPGSGAYISCSSANAHRTHFTKTYDIKTAETEACCHSSCFAFGIDRLSYALLSQLGLDVETWSTSAREELSRYVAL